MGINLCIEMRPWFSRNAQSIADLLRGCATENRPVSGASCPTSLRPRIYNDIVALTRPTEGAVDIRRRLRMLGFLYAPPVGQVSRCAVCCGMYGAYR